MNRIICFFLGHEYRITKRGVPYITLECGCCDKRIHVGEYGTIDGYKSKNEVS